MKRKFYLAYGANTHKTSMKFRCPNAVPVGTTVLPGMRLVFRGVADVVDSKNNSVHAAIWSITAQDEAALDVFEGFPGLYTKRYVSIDVEGVKQRAMMYVMRNPMGQQAEPRDSYRDTLLAGYKDFGLPEAQIHNAIATVQSRAQRVAEGKLDASLVRPKGNKPRQFLPTEEKLGTPKFSVAPRATYQRGQLPLIPSKPVQRELPFETQSTRAAKTLPDSLFTRFMMRNAYIGKLGGKQ